MLTVVMPLPPSANALFRNVTSGGRAKTSAYKAWLEEAGYAARMAHRALGSPLLAAPLQLVIRLGLKDRRRDAGNCLKPIEDMLVKSVPGLPDDRWNDRILVERDADVEPGTAVATIAPIAAPS